jgi:acetoin utilization deacetylase AcuC-like enzyme
MSTISFIRKNVRTRMLMKKTIALTDYRYLNHVTKDGHPESPQRLMAIFEMLKEHDIINTIEIISPRAASKEEISFNHATHYIEQIEKTAGKNITYLDPDTTTSEGSWEAAIFAVGAVLTGIDMILEKKADSGFALVRPPGHHAEHARAMGFCLFNNIAIGAYYLLLKYNFKRILIVDWDIHHGNGTQNSFYTNPHVLYFSTHQFPYYPGSGSFEETGEQNGKGFTVNVPLSGGQGDRDYLMIFNEILRPIAKEYKPEFILVSAGYDIYHYDPLGTMSITPQGFYYMTHILNKIADELCDGRILFTLEGGYHIQGIAESVKQTLRALSDFNRTTNYDKLSLTNSTSISSSTLKVIQRVKTIHSPIWKALR